VKGRVPPGTSDKIGTIQSERKGFTKSPPIFKPIGRKKKYEISKPVVLRSHICSYDMSGSQKLELYWFCSTMDMFSKNDEKRQS
jgi:hypothetical protein